MSTSSPVAPPSVSVVIPVLNGARTIGDTLTGLMNQAPYPGDVEILAVDNGSTDGTPAIVRSFPVALLAEAKLGPSAARNRGLQAAQGDIVAYLDADALPARTWLREITASFTDPDVLLVAGRLLPLRPATPAERYYARAFLDRGPENAALRDFPFAAAANMAVRRSVAQAIGGWDEDFLAAQDVEFSYRLLQHFATTIHSQPGAVAFLQNHTTEEALVRQAFKYGQGRARLWLRYPEVAPMSPARWLHIFAGLAKIGMWPLVARLLRLAGRAGDDDVELAACHRAWTIAYWRGFLSMWRHREWR